MRERAAGFLTWLHDMWKVDGAVPLDQVRRFMAPEVVFHLNGRRVAAGIDAYWARLNALKTQCPTIRIQFPLEMVIAEDDRAAVFWRERLVVDGVEREMVDAAWFRFNSDGLISEFFDVFSGADPVV